jgi:hypothetical protein
LNILKQIALRLKRDFRDKRSTNLHYFLNKKEMGALKYKEFIHKRWRIMVNINNKKVYIYWLLIPVLI